MTLIRQIWLMLFGVLLLALVGSVTIQAVATQQSLRTLMQLHNDEGAAILALALSQQQGDVGRMQPLAVAQFDAGHYQQLRLLDNDGKVLFELEKAAPAGAAPAWFAQLLPVAVKPGVAMIADGRRPLGSVQLHGQASWANDELWAGCWRMAGWLAVLGLAATAMAALALRTWRRSLEAAAAQAQALEERRFIIADEPKLPELRRLTRSMNSLVRRLQRVFEHQAAQLDELRVQAHLDALTGLSKRRHFMAQLDAALQARRHRGAGLLLVRVRELQAMNQRIGHEATDRLLAAVAQVLLSYPRRVKGALTGRLNGADFALYLPAAGLAAETASSLVDALRAALATVDLGAEMVIGGTDLPLATDVAAALSSADAALAQAESRGPFAVEILAGDDANGPALGKDPWKARLVDALQSGRLALTQTEVQDRTGVLLHLECRPGLQLEPGGPFEPATSWLAMARWCRLVAEADLAAIRLALAALQRDGRPRCVRIAAGSMASSGFVSQVQRQLEAAPRCATGLWIELADGAVMQATRVAEASASWRHLGVRLGLQYAGTELRQLSGVHALGIDYIKIDGGVVQGIATVPALRDLVRGLVTLLHSMELLILADAVHDDADLAALWALGLDGASGPALRHAGTVTLV